MNFVLVGDSHVRSYVDSPMCAGAVFLASGKDINFCSTTSIVRFFLCWVQLLLGLRIGKNVIWWVVGEPDVRNSVFGRWHVEYNSKQRKKEIWCRLLDKRISRFRFLCFVLKAFGVRLTGIIGAGSPDLRLADGCEYWNRGCRAVCDEFGLLFFDPQKVFVDSGYSNRFKQQSVFEPVKPDMTHLGGDMVNSFDSWLSRGHLSHLEVLSTVGVRGWSNIVYDERFRCYRLVPSFLVKRFLSGA